MKMKTMYLGKGRRTLMTALLAFLLICIFMGAACFKYYIHLQKTIENESGGYLQEISKLLGDNASRIINDNFSILGTTAMVLKDSGADSFEQLQSVSLSQQEYWKYDHLYLVDAKGITYDSAGHSITLGNEEFLRDVIINNKASMSSSVVVGGKDSVIFAIPVQGLTLDGIDVCAVAASYDLSTFDQILSMTAFGGEAYAHIIRQDGSVVIRSSSKNAGETGYNILNSLSTVKMGGESNFEMLKENIEAGRSGIVNYTENEVRKYMAYTPIASQGWCLLTFVPAFVVSAQSEILLSITLLLCGFITLAFSALMLFVIISFYRNKRSLEKAAYVDPITGGNTIQKFYVDATDFLAKPINNSQYCMIYLNIEKFKVLNEQFGKRMCDELLCAIHHSISDNLTADECIGRQFADNFCILARYESEEALVNRFISWRDACTRYIADRASIWMPHNTEFGVFVIDNSDILIPHMIDRAKLSLTEATCTLNDKMHYAIYNEKVRRILLREKQLEDKMEEALATREFEVYLQPKYFTQGENIGGAEALVRWKSPEEGMIYPDEFIPLFEKNGFVVNIDLFVFEEVCRLLERWSETGQPYIKISVNCSRTHLKSPNFLDTYRRIIEKYKLPPNVLELELTESAVFEDVETLANVIRDIHSLGLGCSMDDFGSGYSSLNLIRGIPVDTLKLDKVFFNTDSSDFERTQSVVGSIISMAQALHMSTVAEGVEDKKQVDMLKNLNCDYIQGYYFAKPMPIEQFEKLLMEDTAKTREKSKERGEMA